MNNLMPFYRIVKISDEVYGEAESEWINVKEEPNAIVYYNQVKEPTDVGYVAVNFDEWTFTSELKDIGTVLIIEREEQGAYKHLYIQGYEFDNCTYVSALDFQMECPLN